MSGGNSSRISIFFFFFFWNMEEQTRTFSSISTLQWKPLASWNGKSATLLKKMKCLWTKPHIATLHTRKKKILLNSWPSFPSPHPTTFPILYYSNHLSRFDCSTEHEEIPFPPPPPLFSLQHPGNSISPFSLIPAPFPYQLQFSFEKCGQIRFLCVETVVRIACQKKSLCLVPKLVLSRWLYF